MQTPNKHKKLYFWPVMAVYFLVIGSAFLLLSTNQSKKFDIKNIYQASSAPGNIMLVLSNDKILGNYLVDKVGMTLYTFKNDPLNQSQCTGECSQNWPPLLIEPDAALGLGLTGTLGAIERVDGTVQLTYNGQALYHYFKDKNMGDTYGDGINNLWQLARP